jgi:acyl carrier protein
LVGRAVETVVGRRASSSTTAISVLTTRISLAADHTRARLAFRRRSRLLPDAYESATLARLTVHATIAIVSEIATVVREIASELGVLATDDRLVSVNSLVMVELIVSLEERLGISLFKPEFDRKDFQSVETVVSMVGRDSGASSLEVDTKRRVETADKATDTTAVEDIAALISALSDDEVTAQLAAWSAVQLEPAPSRVPFEGPRRELFERLLAQHHIDVDAARPLARRTAQTTELTFTQRRIWILHALGDVIRLGQAHGYAIHGPVDIDAFQRAISALVARQRALRTVFTVDGDRVIQTVRERGAELEVVDLASHPSSERMVRARELFDEMASPHDLSRQLFRVRLVRLDEREYLCFIAVHHMVADGFAIGLLWSDLEALYRAAVSGGAPELPALDFEFTDYCFWQTTLEQRPMGRSQLAFWANTIASYEDLEVPGDLSGSRLAGPKLELFTYGEVPFAIEGARWEALTAACSKLRALPYHAISTALFLLLARRGDRKDALVMGAGHNRRRPGSEKVVGNFVTPYLMRLGFDEQLTLGGAVERCREAALAHNMHQGVGPTPTLPRWSELLRYNLNYQILGVERSRTLGGAAVESLGWRIRAPYTVHDLALYLFQRGTSVRGTVVYNAQRYSPELASELATQLHSIIDAIANEPSRRVRELA